MIKKTTPRKRSTRRVTKKTNAPKDILNNTPSISKKENNFKNYLYLGLIVMIIISATALMITQNTKKKNQQQKNQQQVVKQQQKESSCDKKIIVKDNNTLDQRIRQLISINSSEKPIMVPVKDPEALKVSNPAFYKDVNKQDVLVVYKNDKAILYDLKQDRIVTAISIPMQAQTADQGKTDKDNTISNEASPDQKSEENKENSTIQSEKAKITVLNGTMTAGLAGKLSKQLKAQGINVIKVGDAKLKDYTQTVIVKSTDQSMPATLKELQKLTNAPVVSAKPGETKIQGDFTVIIGDSTSE